MMLGGGGGGRGQYQTKDRTKKRPIENGFKRATGILAMHVSLNLCN